MVYQAIGQAMALATTTHMTNSFDISITMPEIEAPSTFLMPISLVRCSAVNAARPKRPRQPTKIAITEKMAKIVPILSSARYISSNRSSRKEYSNGCPEAKTLHFSSITRMISERFSVFKRNDIKPGLRLINKAKGPIVFLRDS